MTKIRFGANGLIIAILLASLWLFAFPTPVHAGCSILSFSVSPNSPQNAGITINLSAKADCGGGVRAMRFKVDGNIIYELGAPEISATWNTSGVSSGSHTLTVEAAGWDDNNWSNPGSSSISFQINSIPVPPTATPKPNPPSCSIQALNVSPGSPQVPGVAISIYGKAACNTGVRAIRFKVDGNIIYELGAPDATATWNSPSSEGNHTITVEAAGWGDDNWNYAASQSTTYYLQNNQPPTSTPKPNPPSCSVQTFTASPASPQKPGTKVTMYGKATCNTGVRAIRFKVNGNIIYELGAPDATATWDTPNNAGSYILTFEAAGWGDDSWSSIASQSITYQIKPSDPPSCSIQTLSTSPGSPQKSGTLVSIYGKAYCNTNVRAIRFRVDGNIIYELGAPDATAIWNTSKASDGSHTITVEAAGWGDDNWTYAALKSETYVIGQTDQNPVKTEERTPNCVQMSIGNRIALNKGTFIRSGSGNGFTIHTIVPEDGWLVDVIGGPRETSDGIWYDISRKNIDGGGTGWINSYQASIPSCDSNITTQFNQGQTDTPLNLNQIDILSQNGEVLAASVAKLTEKYGYDEKGNYCGGLSWFSCLFEGKLGRINLVESNIVADNYASRFFGFASIINTGIKPLNTSVNLILEEQSGVRYTLSETNLLVGGFQTAKINFDQGLPLLSNGKPIPYGMYSIILRISDSNGNIITKYFGNILVNLHTIAPEISPKLYVFNNPEVNYQYPTDSEDVYCDISCYPGHTGLDFDGKIGDSVYASEDGVVVFTGGVADKSYGYYIKILHPNKETTLYAHLSKIMVSKGDQVTSGQVIGKIGNTGNVDKGSNGDGSHLHFEIYDRNGKRVDPEPLINN